LHLLPDRKEVPVVDISVGGVRFSHEPDMEFNPGSRRNFLLTCGDFELKVKGRIVATRPQKAGGRHVFSHTAVQFLALDLGAKQALGKLLNDLLRRQLAERSGLGSR
jgi:hypothetical protein